MEGAEHRYLSVNGIKIHVQIIGEGEPLLLIMGLGAPGEKWARNVREYAKEFRCIVIDNRGAGESDKPEVPSYDLLDMVGDTVGVLDVLGIEKAHINGLSMGGGIAQEIAIRYPERVASLILTSTFCTVTDTFRTAIEFLRDHQEVIERPRLKRLNQWMTFSQKTQNERPEFLSGMAAEDAAYPYPMPVYAYKAQCNTCLQIETTDRLHLIKAPVLIAAGEKDLFACISVTQLMREKIADCELYLCENGGHVHEWEYLDDYNRATLGFLRKHRGVGTE